jgi:hypothetical protein
VFDIDWKTRYRAKLLSPEQAIKKVYDSVTSVTGSPPATLPVRP